MMGTKVPAGWDTALPCAKAQGYLFVGAQAPIETLFGEGQQQISKMTGCFSVRKMIKDYRNPLERKNKRIP